MKKTQLPPHLVELFKRMKEEKKEILKAFKGKTIKKAGYSVTEFTCYDTWK